MSKKIVILGAGAIGSATAKLLQSGGKASIELWDKDPTRVPGQKPLEEILSVADYLFLCLPSAAIPQALGGNRLDLNKDAVVVSLSKGIELSSKQFMDKLLVGLLGTKQPIALLYGPMLASELQNGEGGVAAVATKHLAVFTDINELFAKSGLLLEYSDDVAGVAVAGVLKNIYAIGLGIGVGLRWGLNRQGWLIAASTREMGEVITFFGGKSETAFSSAGLGDLAATGLSASSRNHQFGRALAEAKEGIESEGQYSLPSLISLLGSALKKFPILATISEVVVEKKDVRSMFGRLVD